MALIYADTSALVRAYIPTEAEHATLRELLLDGASVVASEIARVELAAAIGGASRDGRVADHQRLLRRFDDDSGPDGTITLIALRPEVILPRARQIVLDHHIRTLDAIHLAVALEDAVPIAADGRLELVTRDRRQAAAATALGLAVREA